MKTQLVEKIPSEFSRSTWESVRNKVMLARYVRDALKIRKYWDKDHQPRILDFGCGEGNNARLLSLLECEVVGVELREHPQWQSLALPSVVYSGESLPFQDQVFDAVVMFGVLEHVGPDSATEGKAAFNRNQRARLASLQECRRVLKSGGYLFVFNFPNPSSPIEWINNWLKPPARHTGSERQQLQQVEQLLVQAGFELVELERSGVLPASLGTLFPRLRDQVLNRWYRQFSYLDTLVDSWLGKYLGQSNFLVGRKK